MQTRRYDQRSEIGRNVELDERGFLTVPAFVTRTGVFPYKRADGTTVMELRAPEDVFAYESLRTLDGAPITEGHPAEFVTPENAQKLEIGVGGSYAGYAGPLVETRLSFRRADAIAKVQSGDIAEVSCGYTCDIETTSGEWNGQRYDQIQRNIRYNHIAVGPRGWARLGRDMMLRRDSQDAVLDDSAQDADQSEQRNDSAGAAGEGTSMKKIRIDGVEYDIPEQTAAAISKEMERRDAERDTLKAQVDEQRKRADSAEAQRDTIKGQLAVASDPAKRRDEIRARVELERSASKVLGTEEKLDGLSDSEVRAKVLAKVSPSLKLDGKSEEYIAAAYELAVTSAPERNDGLALLGAVVTPNSKPQRIDESMDLDAAHAHRFTVFSGGKGA